MLLDGIIKYQNFKDEFSNEINTNTHLFYVNFNTYCFVLEKLETSLGVGKIFILLY